MQASYTTNSCVHTGDAENLFCTSSSILQQSHPVIEGPENSWKSLFFSLLWKNEDVEFWYQLKVATESINAPTSSYNRQEKAALTWSLYAWIITRKYYSLWGRVFPHHLIFQQIPSEIYPGVSQLIPGLLALMNTINHHKHEY